MKELKIVSLFSGCGGLDKGFLLANQDADDYRFDIVWANDIDPIACETYRRHFGNHIVCADVRDINFDNIPSCDIILGGFPCQDFSMLWKRGGLDTERGNLYLSFCRAIESKHPLIFVAENVKGLLSANNGQAIKQIALDFSHKGYELSYHLYSAADFGVAQFRERVVMVGVRKDAVYVDRRSQNKPVVFPEMVPTHLSRHVSSKEALEGVEIVPHNNERMNIKKRTEKIISLISPGANFTDIPEDSEYYVKGMISHVYRRLNPNKPSTTIIAAGGGGTWGYHYAEPRPLTNRERARLQSFPDNFVFEGSITEVRRQIGNAVPPLLAHAVALNICSLLRGVTFSGCASDHEGYVEQMTLVSV